MNHFRSTPIRRRRDHHVHVVRRELARGIRKIQVLRNQYRGASPWRVENRRLRSRLVVPFQTRDQMMLGIRRHDLTVGIEYDGDISFWRSPNLVEPDDQPYMRHPCDLLEPEHDGPFVTRSDTDDLF